MDVHKHAVLACILELMVGKAKPMTYMETHAGRGLYDLKSAEAQKTGEGKAGIEKLLKEKGIEEELSFLKYVQAVRKDFGPTIYPGSPLIAAQILRDTDEMDLMELHPQEILHLKMHLAHTPARIYFKDGYTGVLGLSPPTPRRGVVLIDPSYEVKREYSEVVDFLKKLQKKWAEAVIMLWYPILKEAYYEGMLDDIEGLKFPDLIKSELIFNDGTQKGLLGSGILILNAPYKADAEIEKIERVLKRVFSK